MANQKPRASGTPRIAVGLLATAVVAAASCLGWPSPASAAPYTVKLCAEGAGHEGITVSSESGTVGLETEDECGTDQNSFEGITQRASGPAGSTAVGAIHWILSAPEGTTIQKLEGTRESSGNWDPDMLWTAFNGTLPVLDKVESLALSKDVEYNVNASFFESSLQCARRPCKPASASGFLTSARLRAMTATMDDTAAPTASLEPTLGTVPVHGTIQIPVLAKDKGAGISKVELIVDGTQKATVTDANGGKCGTAPFKFLVPCKLELTPSFSLDTTQFPVDASHTVKVLVTDASGQTGEASAMISVHNAPVSTQRPALSGQAKRGATLSATTGSWDGGAPPTFAFQWLRCEPGVKDGEEVGCTLIAGATQDHYAPVAGDVGKRDVARVTATNAFGSATALSAPSDFVADQLISKAAPAISGTAKAGSPLHLDAGKWEDAAASQISFAQQWLRCPATVTAPVQSAQCEAIVGATATTYTPVEADVGKRLVAKVTASVSSPQALSVAATSAPSDIVADQNGTLKQGGNSPPQTKIVKHPRKKTAIAKAKFSFSSDQPGAHFQCKLDKGAFKPCLSPFKHKVKPGRHSFAVRAVNPAGVADPTPASYRWKVS